MRKNTLDTDHLQYFRLLRRWMCHQYALSQQDFDLLLALKPLGYFTTKDFDTCTLLVSWEKKRLPRLVSEGWIIKAVPPQSGQRGYGTKYDLSLRAKLMIIRLGKILDGREAIPEGAKNKVMKKNTYSEKLLAIAIKKFNRREE